ncbi:MAG: serine hydrolase [Verrucomicrobiota bacterium]
MRKNLFVAGAALFLVVRFAASAAGYNFSALDARVQGWVDKGYYPGAAVLVAKDNRVVHQQCFGSYTPETEVFIASAGKWLAAAAIMSLVDEGRLSLDDHPSKYLPEFKNDPKDAATLRQMLAHTSGYPPYQPVENPTDHYQTLAESVAHLLPLPAKLRAGERFDYGGLAMQAAGRMAEVAAGTNWEAIFQERIAVPCGMTNTRFTPVDSGGGHAPMLGGGARSNLRDYANFLAMIFNDGTFAGKQVLTTNAIRVMQSDQLRGAMVVQPEFVERVRGTNANHSAIYGLGEWREELDAEGNATLISSPSWAGAYPWIDKRHGVYGVILAHIEVSRPNPEKFSGFYASPVLAQLVRDIVASPKSSGGNFAHPGLLQNTDDFARMRQAIAAREEPVFSGFEKFKKNPQSQSNYVMLGPLEYVGRNPNVGEREYVSDANAAYQCAVMWAITGEKPYAEKSRLILNAWSGRLKTIGGTDAVLMAGLAPFKMINAAEIIRHTGAGWSEADARQAEKSFRDVVYPVLKDFAPFANGNWDSAAMKTLMALAVYADDRELFECVLRYYVNGSGNGSLRHYLIDETGQCQESGRDQQHTQLGLAHLADACEIAWHQGLDLYGYADNRLLRGFEYTARYNLGGEVPFAETLDRTGKYHHSLISTNGRGKLRAVYEQVFNHYSPRRGLPAPFTRQAAVKVRPEGPGLPGADHVGFGTLLYSRPAGEVLEKLPLAAPGGMVLCNESNGLRLSWVAVRGARSYTVKRRSGQMPAFEEVAQGISATTFFDSKVQTHEMYRYVILARGESGCSQDSIEAVLCAGLPTNWTEHAIGCPATTPAAEFNGQFVVNAAGTGIGVENDSCQFVAVPLAQDGEFIVRYVPQVSSQYSQFGLLLRASVAADAACAGIMVTPEHCDDSELPDWRVKMICRSAAGQAARECGEFKLGAPVVTGHRLTGACWLKLVRSRNQCTGYWSTNGLDWTDVGTGPADLGKKPFVGMAVSSGKAGLGTTVKFDQVNFHLYERDRRF